MKARAWLVFAGCLAALPLGAQDPVAVAPKKVTVVLENAQMRVLRMHYGPHEAIPMHSHPPRVVVYLSDFHGKVMFPDGSSREVEAHAKQAQWFQASSHAVENLSDQPFDSVEFELKGQPGPPAKPLELDPAKVDPKNHTIEFENDRVRLIRGTLGPHEKTRWHDHFPRAGLAKRCFSSLRIPGRSVAGSPPQLRRSGMGASYAAFCRELG